MFRADGLGGPWTYANRDLPADSPTFRRRVARRRAGLGAEHAGSARGRVAGAIPHLATVSRTSTSASVAYDGDPQFAPIEGTSLAYAVNTASDVIRVGDAYYLCQNGVWFTAAAPAGPWSVAAAVPDPIYTIPPSSPLYNVTYVRLYQASPDQVVYGYTDGYLGEYVADGVVTWGTGYYYPPYLGTAALPRYYPRPYTYGCDAFYNPANGRFHRVGYGYGPYGGVAAGATYNTATGTYARGAAVYGPYQSGEAVQAYNPRTGTAAVGESRANPYASWEQGVVYGPSAAARGEAYSNDRGTVARVQTADGADVVAAGNGERSAEVVRGPGAIGTRGRQRRLVRRRRQQHLPAHRTGVERADAARADGSIPVRPRRRRRRLCAVPLRPSREVSDGLNAEYAARQRQMMSYQRYSGAWGQRGFNNFAAAATQG